MTRQSRDDAQYIGGSDIFFVEEIVMFTSRRSLPLLELPRAHGDAAPIIVGNHISVVRSTKTSRPGIRALAGIGVLATLALGLSPIPAIAATSTAPMTVTATVQATCVITTTNMAFGTYTGIVLPSTATLSVTCTNTTPYTVGLSAGLGTGPIATVTARHTGLFNAAEAAVLSRPCNTCEAK